MSKIYFLKNPELTYDVEFNQTGEHQVMLIFPDEIPSDDILLSGFNLINENNGYIQTRREDYIYKYRLFPNKNQVELCNDGVIWNEPIHTIKFVIDNHGTLEGDTTQTVRTYEELVVPLIKLDKGFDFIRWSPELPQEGVITEDMLFCAVVEDNNVYFHSSGGGKLEGEIMQFVENYSSLVEPNAISDTNYKFVGWMPELPKNGAVTNDNRHFYAVFESNIPERMNTIESELTDAQIGLVENYDLTVATSQEVTDLQIALVEVYNLLTGGEV